MMLKLKVVGSLMLFDAVYGMDGLGVVIGKRQIPADAFGVGLGDDSSEDEDDSKLPVNTRFQNLLEKEKKGEVDPVTTAQMLEFMSDKHFTPNRGLACAHPFWSWIVKRGRADVMKLMIDWPCNSDRGSFGVVVGKTLIGGGSCISIKKKDRQLGVLDFLAIFGREPYRSVLASFLPDFGPFEEWPFDDALLFAAYQHQPKIVKMLLTCQAVNNVGREKIDVNKRQVLPQSVTNSYAYVYSLMRSPLYAAFQTENSRIAELLITSPQSNFKEPLLLRHEEASSAESRRMHGIAKMIRDRLPKQEENDDDLDPMLNDGPFYASVVVDY